MSCKTIGFRRFVVGFFPYWLGFSCRNIKIARVVDLGFVKLWWWSR